MRVRIVFPEDAPDFARLAKKEPHPQKRVRLIVMAQLKRGMTMGEVARLLGIGRHAIGIWYKRYMEAGLEGLNNKPRPGRPPCIPREREVEFVQRVQDMQMERNGGRVTGYDIQKMALCEFGANYAEDSIYFVLKRLDVSWVTARSKHPMADEEKQEAFKKDFKKNSSLPYRKVQI